jgi:hypothetical protein
MILDDARAWKKIAYRDAVGLRDYRTMLVVQPQGVIVVLF